MFDDLVGIGNLALLDLVRSYDPSRASFATYVSSKLQWTILDAVRRETHGRVASARATAVSGAERFAEAVSDRETGPLPRTIEEDQESLSGFLAGHAAALAVGLVASRPSMASSNPEEEVGRAELASLLKETIGRLSEPKRTLVERHYYRGDPFDAIAHDLGISKSWASRLHAEALAEIARGAQALVVEGKSGKSITRRS
jgi:RNA polymerase sigma factor for flagellar operon FliA